jgi:hypothetical protein
LIPSYCRRPGAESEWLYPVRLLSPAASTGRVPGINEAPQLCASGTHRRTVSPLRTAQFRRYAEESQAHNGVAPRLCCQASEIQTCTSSSAIPQTDDIANV